MFDDFNKRNNQLTDEDIQDYELELGDAETWYESGMTVADAEKLVADRKAYEAQMLVDYKAGRLDPKPGEPGRREFLERKLQEAEMSGDSRLIDPDELDELTAIEFKERNPDFPMPYADKDKRIIPEGLTEEDVDFAILKGEFERKYTGIIDDDLMRTIMADDDIQRVKEVIADVEQAAIMRDKGMSSDDIVGTLKQGVKTRKDNAQGGLNYLMGL